MNAPAELPPVIGADFEPFPKMPRLNRDIVITEKIDGTNAQVSVREADGSFEFGVDTQVDGLYVRAGSRTRWISMGKSTDNFGFAAWVHQNAHALAGLGVGRHFGEWWGLGIQCGYGLHERRFSLFNVGRWEDSRPLCCGLVPVIYRSPMSEHHINRAIELLRRDGSYAAPGFMKPEGIIVYHTAAGHAFKVTLENDQAPKSAIKVAA